MRLWSQIRPYRTYEKFGTWGPIIRKIGIDIVTKRSRNLFFFVFALSASLSSTAYSSHAYTEKMYQMTEKQLGTALRNDIVQQFHTRIAEKRLNYKVRGNDITPTVLKYLPIGISFKKAEEILRSAGFDVSPEPPLNPPGNRPDRFDVFAQSYDLLPPTNSGFKTWVYVILRPKIPGEYDYVYGIISSIVPESL
ncbi:hypothetical protein [Asaia sp. As-1742]|uniref:hypothetical protein n=1 Tax=Asaia sp. As-1742 TaxID=2608325 RepID=UPI0014218A47|nr:hypothetical protein [Asaia sp. As-1742]NIE81790.1 hypothetical protein [Asaia sp. As-1742]